MSQDIRAATKENCIGYQQIAQSNYGMAMSFVKIGDFDKALEYQDAAAMCYIYAYERLERLIGVS